MFYFEEIVWVIIIMITTAGYGDLAPRSTEGRLMCFLASIFGIFTFSLFLVSLNQL